MARKRKAPEAQKIVNISLTEIDLVAKGTELANRMKQVKALKDQKAEENARFQKLIDEQIELCDAIASQILGGTEARNQASLKVGEDGALTVPEKPFNDSPQVPPPKAPDVNAVTVLEPPTSCADCGSRVQMIDDSGIYACRDENALGCTWTAVVETADTAQALGASA